MTPEQLEAQLSIRLRTACEKLRRTPMAIADVIPMLQEAADALDTQRAAPVSEAAMVATNEHVKVLVEAQGYKFHKIPEDVKTRDRKAIQAVFDATTSQPVEVQPVGEVMQARDVNGVPCYVQVDEVDRTFTFPLYKSAQPVALEPLSDDEWAMVIEALEDWSESAQYELAQRLRTAHGITPTSAKGAD